MDFDAHERNATRLEQEADRLELAQAEASNDADTARAAYETARDSARVARNKADTFANLLEEARNMNQDQDQDQSPEPEPVEEPVVLSEEPNPFPEIGAPYQG